jgi:hypothetical protein
MMKMNQELPLVKGNVDAKFKLEREALERRAYDELKNVDICPLISWGTK